MAKNIFYSETVRAMKYIEDDFDLEEFKKQYGAQPVMDHAPAAATKNKAIDAAITVLLWVLAFLVAYPLFKGGQFLIDLFLH